MNEAIHATMSELEAQLDFIRGSPSDGGTLEMIVCRPQVDEREVLNEATLDLAQGLAGDNWKIRGNARTWDRAANPEMQVTLMNSRAAAVVARSRERWRLAGDQFFVDLDLSLENLPPGTRLVLGEAMIEVTPPPHTGCKKFLARFGTDALAFVNSPLGRQLNLRGIHARVLRTGVVRVGVAVKKV
jgi:MOSC domain